ncbi:hypothetical protein N9954_07945 [Maribacter sp.]|nr:hypothetical protein [Maribacter sp.]
MRAFILIYFMICAPNAFSQTNPIRAIKNAQMAIKIITRSKSTYDKVQRHQAAKNSSNTLSNTPRKKVVGFDYPRPAEGAEDAMRILNQKREFPKVEITPAPINLGLIIPRYKIKKLQINLKGVKIIDRI